MKADLINHLLDEYYKSLMAGRMSIAVDILDENYHNFQTHWNVAADDFGSMYDQTFTSSKSQRYWVDKGYFPKEAIMAFINDDHDFVKSVFRSLMEETKEVDGRVSRFMMAVDALLASHNKGEQKLPLHYHEDRRMILFYLTMMTPSKYFHTNQSQLSRFVNTVKSNTPVHTLDIDRVSKVSKILEVFMNKHEGLIEYIKRYASKHALHFEGLSFWKSDFMEYMMIR